MPWSAPEYDHDGLKPIAYDLESLAPVHGKGRLQILKGDAAMKRQMRLGMSMRGLGYHPAAWRHPKVPADGSLELRALRPQRPGGGARALRHDLLRRRHRHPGEGRTARLARPLRLRDRGDGADDAAAGARRADQAHRPRHHGVDHLQRALPRRPQIRDARPHQRRPRRLEHRHLLVGGRGPELQPGGASRLRHALRARRRIRRGRHRPVGQLGARRLPLRQGRRALLRREPHACAEPRRQAFPGARPAERGRHAAGPPHPGPGRRLRAGPGDRRRDGRCRLCRAGQHRRMPRPTTTT